MPVAVRMSIQRRQLLTGISIKEKFGEAELGKKSRQ